MRECPKCGSYVPEGKLFCTACGRISVGLLKGAHDSTLSEKRRTTVKLEDDIRKATVRKGKNNPYAGGTYEQHKSHDLNSTDYYKSKQESGQSVPDMTKRIICAAAYFGIFFFLPLVAMPGSEEAKFHANQGLVLFLFGIALGAISAGTSLVLGSMFEVLVVIHPLLMVYGASNAFKGNMTELPLIGKLRILKGYDRF